MSGSESDSLTDDEVRQITFLVETLDRSTFDFLQVNLGKLKVTVGKGNASPALTEVPAPHVAVPEASAPVPLRQSPLKEGPAEDGAVEIVTPMMGRFYAKPEPGADPFVTVGSEVDADTVVGLVEVMKVFTAVRAGVAGVITEICVEDAALVEYGHVLFRVRPLAPGSPGSQER